MMREYLIQLNITRAALDQAEAERERLRDELAAIGKYASMGSSDKVQLFHMLTSIANTCEQALRAEGAAGGGTDVQ
jgi:hypothetical protein